MLGSWILCLSKRRERRGNVSAKIQCASMSSGNSCGSSLLIAFRTQGDLLIEDKKEGAPSVRKEERH
mgnify:CR=1 FL=1